MALPPLNLQLIYDASGPRRAIIDLAALKALLEAAEDMDDLRYLEQLKAREPELVSWETYLRTRDESAETGGDGPIPDRHREAG